MVSGVILCKRIQKSFYGTRKGKYLVIDSYYCFNLFQKILRKGLPVTKEGLMLKARKVAVNSDIQLNAGRGWCENVCHYDVAKQYVRN